MEPYRGLQPYTEENEDIFFGREAEKAILIDKLLSEKLSLLFAATGVGKSSLLQAAVMPELKRPAHENLDVVYYNDWVTDPLLGLPQKILAVLRERGKIAADFAPNLPLQSSDGLKPGVLTPGMGASFPGVETPGYSPQPFQGKEGNEPGVNFKDFLHICATFASEPLVIILDQFEEFFQYHRYSPAFQPFIEQFAEAVRDRATPVAFLISMREDFALNLNAFKGHLQTTLFENYYRLEKLDVQAAAEAIQNPVAKVAFRYETGLVAEMLKDLADQEREGRVGGQAALLPENAPAFVEAPNVQIVCQQLWELEKGNSDKIIRIETYKAKGRSRGFINSYFASVIAAFSPSEKKLASKAFDHLVTPRGTKMAYPVKDLSAKLRVKDDDLRQVLVKLEKARVLRSQPRKDEIWYELYHDTFSGIIHQWNNAYKSRQRTRKVIFGVTIGIIALCFVLAVYDIFINLTNYHFRISPKSAISDRIEVYQGMSDSWNFFNLHHYNAETLYKRNHLEPDKQFITNQIGEYQNLNSELIAQLPIVKRISEYWKAGEIEKALKLADQSIGNDDMDRTQSIIELLSGFNSQQSFEILKKHLVASEDMYIRKYIISIIRSTQFTGVADCLIMLLKDDNWDIRRNAAKELGKLGDHSVEDSLIALLKDENNDVKRSAVTALGQINSEKAANPLMNLLQDPNSDIRSSVAEALGNLDNVNAFESLKVLLKDQNPNVRKNAAFALGKIRLTEAVTPLIELIKDTDLEVKNSAIEALYQLSIDERGLSLLQNSNAVSLLLDFLKEQIKAENEQIIQTNSITLLIRLGNDKTVGEVVNLLNDPNPGVRRITAQVLSLFGNNEIVKPLVNLLHDQNLGVRNNAIEGLYRLSENEDILNLLRNYDIFDLLVQCLKEQIKDVQMRRRYPSDSNYTQTTKFLAKLDSNKAVIALIELLKDQDSNVQKVMAELLGELVRNEAVSPLLELLKTQNADIQCSAVQALGQLGKIEAMFPLISLLQNQDSTIRSCVAKALGDLGKDESVKVLIKLLKDQNAVVRSNAIEALGKFNNNMVVSQLRELLNERDLDVQSKVVVTLCQSGGGDAIGQSLELLQKPYITYSSDTPYGYPFRDLREEVVTALGQIGTDEAVEGLIELMNEGNQRFSRENVTRSVINALSQIGNSQAVNPLIIKSLILRWYYMRYSQYYMIPSGYNTVNGVLGKLGSSKAIKPMKRLRYQNTYMQYDGVLALGKLSVRETGDSLKMLIEKGSLFSNIAISPDTFSDKISETRLKLSVTAVLLSFGQEYGLEFLNKQSVSKYVDERKQVVAVLGEAPSEKGNQILLSMLNDKDMGVKFQVIESLGHAQVISALPLLYTLLENSEPKRRETIINAIGEIASSDSINLLKQIALNGEERVTPRIAAIKGLGSIGTEEAATTLLEVLEKADEHYHYKTIMALGKTRSKQALPKLLELLHEQERRKAAWRKVRDENTDGYGDKQMDDWRKRLATVEPQTYMEFELAHSIAMIDPDGEGVNLLSHDLAKVREGVWMGLARLPLTATRPFYVTNGPAAVNLIARLDKERMTSGNPFFKHAAYRAIDEMLITLEAYGRKPELDALQAFLPNVQDPEGVKTRVEWTIDRLQERNEE